QPVHALTHTGRSAHVKGVAYSPDGRWLASAALDARVFVRDAASGEERGTFPVSGFADRGVGWVAFARDSHALACAGGRDVRVRDPDRGTDLLAVQADARIRSLAISPDCRLVAAGDFPGKVTVWDVRTGRAHVTLPANGFPVLGLAFVP